MFSAHDTWDTFDSMLRILKLYNFNYHFNDRGNILVLIKSYSTLTYMYINSTFTDEVEIPGTSLAFSSYPGTMMSIDDFYVTNANLAIIETTIGNSNADLWKFVTPQLNSYWVRILVASRLASNGVEWAKWFSEFNSGTYVN